MDSNHLRTMIFSKNPEFRNECVNRLERVDINDTLCTDSFSFVKTFVTPGMRGIVIYDTNSGDEVLKQFIAQKRISE